MANTPRLGLPLLAVSQSAKETTLNQWLNTVTNGLDNAALVTIANTFTQSNTYANSANLIFGTGAGSMLGTAANQKIALWGATPVVQRPNNTDLKQVFIDIGALPASVAATNLNLNGGQLTVAGASFSSLLSGDPSGAGTPFQVKPVTVTPPTNADYTLTAAEMSAIIITVVAGSWVAGHNILVPDGFGGGVWHFSNSSGFSMTVRPVSGTGIAIATGRAAWIRTNGVNCRRCTPDCDPTV